MVQKAAMEQAALFKTPSDVPRVNFAEVLEDTAELYSKKDFDRYLLDSNVEIPPEPEQDNTRELLNFSYKDAPPDIKAQIEVMYGLQPSALHDTSLVGMAYDEAKKEAEIENGGMINGQPTRAGNSPAPAVA